MHELAQKLCHVIARNELLHPGDRVGVAVSGGPDSVALLRVLRELRKELGIVLSVVHVNHKLRGADSDADADFVCSLAREHKLQFHSTIADVGRHAAEAGISIEAAARELRYEFFRELLGEEKKINRGLAPMNRDSEANASDPCVSVRIGGAVLDKIATGHTLDDQAETVLMRVIRGTGIRGLRAIQPRIRVETEHGTSEIIRPLLQIRREELKNYLSDIGQSWREDTTNRDPKFTRNRVRQMLLPMIEREFNPAIAERLAELAEVARAEEEFWENEAAGWMDTGIHLVEPRNGESQLIQLTSMTGATRSQPIDTPVHMNAIVDLAWLLSEELAVQRRIVKAVADAVKITLEFAHVDEILRLASENESAGKELVLPGGWRVVCEEDALEFVAPEQQVSEPASGDYELSLSIPGEVTIPQIGSRIQALLLGPEEFAGCEPDHLFDAALLDDKLVVRNWRPGDRFWPAHTKAPKKIKELLQERHVPQAQRRAWPVVLNRGEVIWVKGFPGRAQMRPAKDNPAVLIQERSL